MSKPNVFIIESLELKNEKDNLFEGQILSNILNMNNKGSIYYYIRTKKELINILNEFANSDFRYLHFSCHGGEKGISTTFDFISFEDLTEMLIGKIDEKRLFFSACSVASDNLASNVLSKTKCTSILGPYKDVYFADSAILWASFYHLMFKENSKAMKRKMILKTAQSISDLFKMPLKYFYQGKDSVYRRKIFNPNEPMVNENEIKDQAL